MWLSIKPAVADFYIGKAKKAEMPSKPFFLEKAWSWDENPETQYMLGATYLDISELNPAARIILLRKALGHAQNCYYANPVNPHYRYLLGAILWRLGRERDSWVFLQDYKK
jgi:hypothetical protein